MTDDKAFEIIEKKSPDEFSRQDVVNAFQRAFTIIGGVQRFTLWANENPDRFFPLYAKLLPSTAVNLFTSGPPRIEHSIPPSPLDVHPGQEQVTYVVREEEEAK